MSNHADVRENPMQVPNNAQKELLGVPQTSLQGIYSEYLYAHATCGHVVPRGSHMTEGGWMIMLTLLNIHVFNVTEVNT